MRKNIYRFLSVFWLIHVMVLISCGMPATSFTNPSEAPSNSVADSCIPPLYGDFSYPISSESVDMKYPGINMSVLPPAPWDIEVSLPEIPGIESTEYSSIEMLQARSLNDAIEIWVRVSVGFEEQAYFLVYRTDTEEWKLIPERINLLIVDKDGTLWGSYDSKPVPSNDSMIKKFNEQTNTFEKTSARMPISPQQGQENNYYGQTLLDNNGIFWMLIPEQGIYKFNPITSDLKKVFDLSFHFRSAKIDSNGIIYLLVYNEFTKDGGFEIQSLLYRYDTNTGDSNNQNLRYLLEPYPLPAKNLFLDSRGRIWLDSIAYRDEAGIWRQIQRSPLFVSPIREVYSDYRYKTAEVVLESSDKRLWFLHLNNGMIFLNPDKGEWCWFTTYQSNIVEDVDHNLWMIADGKLYKYPLQP